MRVACGTAATAADAADLYRLMVSKVYLPSTPTLFNAGTVRPQLSSCYLVHPPHDSIEGIYACFADIARLSKYAGGIGVAWHSVRSNGSHIAGTNGFSRGVVPWLRVLDASTAAVSQGSRRKGAVCAYLETWHADIESFLELCNGAGDHNLRTYNINIANWVPDLFMERVRDDQLWSLFDPRAVPGLADCWGDRFRELYLRAEAEGLAVRQLPARQLYTRMLRTLAETGRGWFCFKDHANAKANQTQDDGGPTVQLANLCTEIVEVTDSGETAVCNLGSINLAELVVDGRFDFAGLGRTVEVAVGQLDRVVDINLYPTEQSRRSNMRWRPVGLGRMGLQDLFQRLGLPFGSVGSRQLDRDISATIYWHALAASCRAAERQGAYPAFADSRTARGCLQQDLWPDVGALTVDLDWVWLRERIARFGLRNSLLVAVAPTATIASILGTSECIEPRMSNIHKRETLSGEFLQVNRLLVAELKRRGLWTAAVRAQLRADRGSVQQIEGVPADVRELYRTVWEISQRTLIDMAVERGAYIDQSQSLNLFLESPTIDQLASMYMYAWESGVKTTYYLRSRPATEISQTVCALDSQECEACT